MSDCVDGIYHNHSKEVSRINRVIGQLEGVKKMISDHRDCQEIMAQIRAIRSAIHAIETNVLHDHLQACVHHILKESESDPVTQSKIEEISSLFKKYN